MIESVAIPAGVLSAGGVSTARATLMGVVLSTGLPAGLVERRGDPELAKAGSSVTIVVPE
jgi:hypothetical protein